MRMAEREPWLRRPDWASGRIVYSYAKEGAGLLIFAFVWCGFTSGLASIVIRGTDGYLRWLILFFPVVGLTLLWAGVRGMINALRFRTSTLLLESVPQEPGTVFRARVESARFPDGAIHASMQCVHRSGNDRTVLWSGEHTVAPAALLRLPDRVAVPVKFQIPAEARETQAIAPNEEILWQLILGFGGTGAAAEVSCHFEIPVFRKASAER
jgi:hypothetical protein